MELSNMVSILKQMFKSLSADEQQSFLDSLKNEPKDIKGFESLKQAVIKRNPNPLPDRCNCPHCQSTDVVKTAIETVFKDSCVKNVKEHLPTVQIL